MNYQNNPVEALEHGMKQELVSKNNHKADEPKKEAKSASTCKLGYIFYIIMFVVMFVLLLVIIIALVLAGISPCSISRCHPNATCINRPFYAECSCKHGFTGDGQHHCDECGFTFYPQSSTRIGSPVNPYSWPAYGVLEFEYSYFAEVQEEKLLLNTYDYCAVTVISRKFLLTSARCVKTQFTYFDWYYQTNYTFSIIPNALFSSIEAMYNIYLGAFNFVYYGIDLPEVYIGYIDRVIVHPDFDPYTFQNDLALIKLRFEINFDNEVQPACLPEDSFANHLEPQRQAVVVGYGTTNRIAFRRFSLSNTLISIMNGSMCDLVDPVRTKDWTKQFCAGEFDQFNNQTNYCMGDIGSALYMPHVVNEKFKFVATGILSYNEGCATQHTPAVYTSVVAYKDWIKQNSRY